MNPYNYNNLTPFKWCILQNFPFIEADFDAITEYQLLCKVVEYLNNTINSMNDVGQQMENVTNAMTQLQNYVNNYFDNLDVQDEINNKLNEMTLDGTLSSIINGTLFTDMNNKILQNSTNIGSLNNEMENTIKQGQANSITNDMLSQEVRESITGGSTAVVGVNAISNENIQNNAITILNLDEDLKKNFNKDYQNVDYNTNLSGFCRIVDNELDIVQNNQYVYGIVNLDNNTIYNFGYKNIGQLIAIIIVDPSDSDKIVYSTNDGLTSGTRNVSISFKTNKTGLQAYISKYNGSNYFENNGILFTKTNKIQPNYTLANSISLLKTFNYKYMRITSQVGGYLAFNDTSSNNVTANVKIYKLSKGVKYKVHGANYVQLVGLAILNESGLISYLSSTEEVRPLTYFDYEFTATDNGYACLQDYDDTNIGNSNIIESTIEIENIFDINNLMNKKWVAFGDSLTAVNTLGSDVKNYTNYVSEKLGLSMSNYGVGGTGYWRGNTNSQAFYQRIQNIPTDTDVITIFGSFNDLGTEGSTTGLNIIGNITDTGTDTICGCINTTLDNLITRTPNALIGIIAPTPWSDCNMLLTTARAEASQEYVEKLKQIAERRSIPFLDLYKSSNLRPWESAFRTTFYNNADGVHPNTYGHQRISAMIEEFIKSIVY